VAKGVELARGSGGTSTVLTLGPSSADDCLREAIACGVDEGVLVSDPAFAGSDTLATASALAAALRQEGPFDLILCGRNSVDADTGQTPAEVAELLDLPFAAGVRELALAGEGLEVRCEHDDGWLRARLPLPALLSCAERLCAPAKATPEERAAVAPDRIRRLTARDLGEGPWGAVGSPTVVGRVQRLAVERLRLRLRGDLHEQVSEALRLLDERGAFSKDGRVETLADVPPPRGAAANPLVAVAIEPGREQAARELLGAAARLAASIGGSVAAISCSALAADDAGAWGADVVVPIAGADVEEDVAAALAGWCSDTNPWAVLAPGTMWGREVLGRAAARLRTGLVGDAVDLDVDDGRLVSWKPAFGGELVAAITCRSSTQMATVRAGVLPLLVPRRHRARIDEPVTVVPRRRMVVAERTRDDDIEVLATADAIVTVGHSVDPESYVALQPLLHALGAELAGTRKVTDNGWLPRSRQVGLTGRSLSPRVYIAIGVAGKFNHIIGARGAGIIAAINTDATAPIFEQADIGIVGDWREVVPLLVEGLTARRAVRKSAPVAPAD
jgi:electron transfer flavoprotein alpha subunit